MLPIFCYKVINRCHKEMNPIKQIQNYRKNYSVMNVPSNLRTDIFKFNLKRKIIDKELSSVLDKRIEEAKAESEMWKQKTAMVKREIELMKIEEEEEECTEELCWCKTLKGKELKEAKEAYENSEV